MDSNMRNTKNGLRILMTLLVILLILLAMGSHALPMATDGDAVISGLEFLRKADALAFPKLAIPVALVVTASALVFALTALIRKKALIGTCICAVVSAALLAYGVKGDIATAGVIAFFDFHVFAVACAIVAMNVKPRKKKETAAVPVVEAPVSNTCPACGKPLDADSAFCGYCGTPIPAPQVVPEPAPVRPVCARCGAVLAPNDKFCLVCGSLVGKPTAPARSAAATKTCAGCGAEMGDGEAFCGFCGTPAASAPSVPAQEPAQPQNPEPVPVQEQPASCSVCGKPLLPGAKFCLGCGAPVGVAGDVKKTCAKCGAEMGDGEAFCGFCGTPARK